ncbi:hypothetical protein AB0K00_21875 [Dactylosporangium sp. NPDC049525]|uniref:hypothetical protein n=1 Tax=Dactylosporangium sp. NPDC049525 TaxID=3154730 RepID=UPI0034286539
MRRGLNHTALLCDRRDGPSVLDPTTKLIIGRSHVTPCMARAVSAAPGGNASLFASGNAAICPEIPWQIVHPVSANQFELPQIRARMVPQVNGQTTTVN